MTAKFLGFSLGHVVFLMMFSFTVESTSIAHLYVLNRKIYWCTSGFEPMTTTTSALKTENSERKLEGLTAWRSVSIYHA